MCHLHRYLNCFIRPTSSECKHPRKKCLPYGREHILCCGMQNWIPLFGFNVKLDVSVAGDRLVTRALGDGASVAENSSGSGGKQNILQDNHEIRLRCGICQAGFHTAPEQELPSADAANDSPHSSLQDRHLSAKLMPTFADRGVSRSQRCGYPTTVISVF
jgi:hypothetical protein